MIDEEFYQARPPKKRRRTKAEMLAFSYALADIVKKIQPCTVRQCFYQATVKNVVEKTESGYGMVQRALVDARRIGLIPFGHIVDNTRYSLKPKSYDGVTDFLEITSKTYRRAVWTDIPFYVEVWLEKDALRGVLYPVTEKYDVPLMVSRGYASLSFLHGSAETFKYYAKQDKLCYLLHLGDHDPSGVNAAESIRDTIKELAPEVDLRFQRLAVTRDQIERWKLPSRPTKKTDTREKNWTGGDSVELDAIPPQALRDLVEHWLELFVPSEVLDTLSVAEKSERELMRSWAGAA